MAERNKDESGSLEDSRIVRVEVLNSDLMIFQFSNGTAAVVDCEKVRQFALASATRFVSPGQDGSEDDEEMIDEGSEENPTGR